MRERATLGPAAFESEYQSNPVDPAACEWPEEYFNWPGFWFDAWPKHLEVRVTALDPSKGKDAKHGDYSAIVDYGRDANGNEYIEGDLARRPATVIVADLVKHVLAFNPDVVVLEAIAFQELFAAPIQAAFAAAHITTALTLEEDVATKIVRVRRLTGMLHQRRGHFRARSPGTALGVRQMQDFPNGDHDDFPDAVEKARRAAIELVNGKAKKKTMRVNV